MNTILPNCPSTPDGTPDYKWDGKDSGQLFLSQKAWSYGVRTFYANAWSAPGCMKTNNNDANGGQLCGVSLSLISTQGKRTCGLVDRTRDELTQDQIGQRYKL